MTAASSPEPVPVYVRTGNWADDANCLGMNPDIFFPTRGEDVARARAICRACDVQVECAHYALNQDDTLQGIWGGLTHRDRRRIRRGRAATGARSVGTIEHGTDAGYRRHNTNTAVYGPPCSACREAHVAAVAERKQRSRQRSTDQGVA